MAHFLHIKDMYLATYLQLQLIYQHATHLYLNRILSIIS